jgi:Papain-like cysteine protease AvrRpt2
MPAFAFYMQPQARTNWCWAATAVSVQRYYRPNDRSTQCWLVCVTLNRNDCCNNPPARPDPCNVPGALDVALNFFGRLALMVLRPATLPELAQEVAGLRPLCLRVAWWRGGAHFMACTGYLPTNVGLFLLIHDPWYGTSWVPAATFPMLYQGANGIWTTTYFTRP